jgi:DNA gyrase/topoisomerase IV subunit A
METAKEIMDALETSELKKEVEELKTKVADLEKELKSKTNSEEFWRDRSEHAEKAFRNLKRTFINFVEDMKCDD